MTEFSWRILIFTKDLTGSDLDSFYWFVEKTLIQTDARNIVEFQGAVICHDFWMVRDTIFIQTGRLPSVIIDLDEFHISTSGLAEDRRLREKNDITAILHQHGLKKEICSAYKRIFNKGSNFEPEIVVEAAIALIEIYNKLSHSAKSSGEWERFFDVEVPIYNILQTAMAKGINIDTKRLSYLRSEAEYNYFNCLKNYSAKHDMPLETPSENSLEARLIADGFEKDDVSIDYILEFMPHPRDFGNDTIELQEADAARKVLGSLTLATNTIHPLLDVFGSRTSRIQLRSPALQNIPKKYRSIIVAREGFTLCYVDYDQFEVGVMAAISGDRELKTLYATGDMYEIFATEHLRLHGNRKAAKQLFLSYAYGMSKKALVDAAVSFGVDRQVAKDALGMFEQYEAWKKTVWKDFEANNRAVTLLGNQYVRTRKGPLTGKEKRSVVSQIIQGTASLIFKKSLIEVSKMKDVYPILPMHDALLFEHRNQDTPAQVILAFESTMTSVLKGMVQGKASISDFAPT